MDLVDHEIRCDECGIVPETVRAVGVIAQELKGWMVEFDLDGEKVTLCPFHFRKLHAEHGDGARR